MQHALLPLHFKENFGGYSIVSKFQSNRPYVLSLLVCWFYGHLYLLDFVNDSSNVAKSLILHICSNLRYTLYSSLL